MIVTAWTDGQQHASGAGYGLKIDAADRDRYFQREWQSIMLILEGKNEPVEINVNKASFWNKTCRELISVEVGRWLMKNELVPWTKGHPPKLVLEPFGEEGHFLLKKTKMTN